MPGPREELEALEAAGLRRHLRPLDSPAGHQVVRDGRVLWNFSSNDYLGLAAHPRLAEAMIEGVRRYGSGSAASRLVSGTLPPHRLLEQHLAQAKRTEAALVFSSGFATPLGVLPALAGRHDFIVLDKLAHACLVDGARLSGATIRVFPHNDCGRLSNLLDRIRAKHPQARIIVATESVFSMDGDLCPLREIVEIAAARDALLLLDEAHAFGVFGETGMGLAEREGLQGRITFQMGTFSKAAGLAGGYLAASADWIELLVNRARSFVFSTAPPPALAHAALEALAMIRSAEGAERRTRLAALAPLIDPAAPSPIIPRILGSAEDALAAAAQLDEAGFLVPAIRYPTVPRGRARLRISLSAAHPPDAVQALAAALARLDAGP